MIFKDVKLIKKELSELKETLTINIESIAKVADELESYLANVGLKVKSITEFYEEDGTASLRINYEAPQVVLRFTADGELLQNETFKSINMLNLVSSKDMELLTRTIDSKKNKIRLTK